MASRIVSTCVLELYLTLSKLREGPVLDAQDWSWTSRISLDQSEKFYPITQIDGFLSPKRGEPESDRTFNKEAANEPE